MIPALILILALIIGIYFIAKWWVQADPKQLILALRWAGILLAAILAIAIFKPNILTPFNNTWINYNTP